MSKSVHVWDTNTQPYHRLTEQLYNLTVFIGPSAFNYGGAPVIPRILEQLAPQPILIQRHIRIQLSSRYGHGMPQKLHTFEAKNTLREVK